MRHALALLLIARTSLPNAVGPLDLPTGLQRLLDDGVWDAATPEGFHSQVLYFTAEGCAARAQQNAATKTAAIRCIESAIRRMTDETWSHLNPAETDDGLLLANLAVMWGARDGLIPCPDPSQHRQMVDRLVRLSLDDAHSHAPSFGSSHYRWPADQSIVLQAISRFDAHHHTTLLREPLTRWRTVVKATEKAGLPASEVAVNTLTSKQPRGCAQAMLARVVPEFDAALACRWWPPFRQDFLISRSGLAGFREYRAGFSATADEDSGPIVLGIGVAASALGIAGAKAMGDTATATRLEASAAVAKRLPMLQQAAHTLLAQAITYQSDAQSQLVQCP